MLNQKNFLKNQLKCGSFDNKNQIIYRIKNKAHFDFYHISYKKQGSLRFLSGGFNAKQSVAKRASNNFKKVNVEKIISRR